MAEIFSHAAKINFQLKVYKECRRKTDSLDHECRLYPLFPEEKGNNMTKLKIIFEMMLYRNYLDNFNTSSKQFIFSNFALPKTGVRHGAPLKDKNNE